MSNIIKVIKLLQNTNDDKLISIGNDIQSSRNDIIINFSINRYENSEFFHKHEAYFSIDSDNDFKIKDPLDGKFKSKLSISFYSKESKDSAVSQLKCYLNNIENYLFNRNDNLSDYFNYLKESFINDGISAIENNNSTEKEWCSYGGNWSIDFAYFEPELPHENPYDSPLVRLHNKDLALISSAEVNLINSNIPIIPDIGKSTKTHLSKARSMPGFIESEIHITEALVQFDVIICEDNIFLVEEVSQEGKSGVVVSLSDRSSSKQFNLDNKKVLKIGTITK